jgi:hypothetical protein
LDAGPRELKRRGVTLLLLWEEYRAEHADGYGSEVLYANASCLDRRGNVQPQPLASGDMALWALIKKQYGAMLTSLCRSHRIDRRDRGFLAPRWTHDKRAGAARQSTAQKSINLYYPAAEGLGVRDFRMNSGD